ncbi:thiopurine S-methyltransferase [Lysobacter sp. 5GHs7-4]|uniref:thiopurine S-methyltransferase n=1 Tax=Lysobacter sp. 5GHs7-4 TaxID=2904253 RepID=UPI001E635102|nr:thiopurine S-methyltransferase [Lysobacter sp. 5GHs7-4]UHQ21982.1 thiopurine S-methyltransferase [Lysobacter sp. 5GHs7-4]
MEAEFWRQRWQDNQIGFHQDRPSPLLLKHWPSLALAVDSRVFVPLAGKTLDMLWFAAQGHRVLGVELSRIAVEDFFAEHGLRPEIAESRYGLHYRAGAIELICGDAFALDAELLADCAAVFDRAALIALPPPLRRRYAGELYPRLPQGCRGLLITLEYPQHEKQGPPFCVGEQEVRALYARDWGVNTLERRDILAQQPSFVAEGVSALETIVYALERR